MPKNLVFGKNDHPADTKLPFLKKIKPAHQSLKIHAIHYKFSSRIFSKISPKERKFSTDATAKFTNKRDSHAEIKALKKFGPEEMTETTHKTINSIRGRCPFLFHSGPQDPVQRFVNGLKKGTYIPVHKHCGKDRWEQFVYIEGEFAALIFDDEGKVTDRVLFNGQSYRLLEIPENTYHTVVCLSDNAMFFELKKGPYDPINDKTFAPWCPTEDGDKDTIKAYVEWFASAPIGASIMELEIHKPSI